MPVGISAGAPPHDSWNAPPYDAFGADALSSSDDFEEYTRTVSTQIARVEIGAARKDRFQHQIGRASVGPLHFTYIRSDPLEIHRTARCIELDSQNQYLVGINLMGAAVINHAHRQTLIGANRMFLLDKAIPYCSIHHETTSRVLVSIPRRLLESRLPDPNLFLSVTPSITSGIGKLAAGHLRFLASEGMLLTNSNRVQAVDMALDLVALSFQSAEEAAGMPEACGGHGGQLLLSRAKAYMRCHLDDPELDPGTVAKAMNISKRYLHKLFSTADTTFGTWVREERLARAHALLIDERFDHLSITEIALRQGFNDIPHFSRQFRARFGYPPRMARNDALRST